MSRLSLFLVIAFVVPLNAEVKIDVPPFQKDDLGKLPKGWTAAKTGEGEGSVWKVQADGDAYVLTQTAAGPNRLYNVCVLDTSSFADGELSVQVKAVSGDIDQGGGLVWRYVDAKNYYTCRFNPLEKNFRLYFVKDGIRKELASKEKIDLSAGKPFSVTVRHVGKDIVCELNGEHKLQATDATFSKEGKVGLWTKADAVTSFQKLTIRSKP